MRKNNILIVLGMHRSGTSVTANWLHECGLHLGDRLMGASIGNVQGHFEDLDFHDLHEEVFMANGVSYGGLEKVPDFKLTANQKIRFKDLISTKNGLHKNWGWKEPRTCLFIDIYEEISSNLSYLIVYRKADEVVNSLLKRRKQEVKKNHFRNGIIYRLKYMILQNKINTAINKEYTEKYFESWVLYNQKILALTKKINKSKYVVSHYSELLSTSNNIISWINGRGFGLKMIPFHHIFDKNLISKKNKKINISNTLREQVNSIETKLKEIAGDFIKGNNTFANHC